MRWKVLHWPISQSAVQRSRNKQATARMTSLLIVILTTRVACITRFDQWDIFNDVTFQNIPRNSPDVVAEILCVAGSLGRRMCDRCATRYLLFVLVEKYVWQVWGYWAQRLTLFKPFQCGGYFRPKHKNANIFEKTSKSCHVGIHWIALTGYSQMSTHMPGFQWFFRMFALSCISQISHQQHKG